MSDGARKMRIGPLDTVGGVCTELAKVYREARRGDLDMSDAKAGSPAPFSGTAFLVIIGLPIKANQRSLRTRVGS